jgi:hypothetical protein
VSVILAKSLLLDPIPRPDRVDRIFFGRHRGRHSPRLVIAHNVALVWSQKVMM